MLRILQVSDAYYPFPGGVSEHLHHLTVALRQRGHDARILTGRYPGTYEDPPWVHRVGQVRVLPALGFFNKTQLTLTLSPGLPLEVRAFFRQHRFDIVHTHGPLALNLPFLALHYGNGVQVATFHTAFVGWNFNRIGKVFFRRAARKIARSIVVSRVAWEAVAPHYPGRYVLVPNGIDLTRFRPDGPLPPLNLRRPVILYLGRMEPRKGFPLLLEAFRRVKRRLPEATLLAVGGGAYLETYRRRVPPELRNSVHFTGFVPARDLPAYYRYADLYTSPAIGGETFGIVLLEAMASGTPVVASDIPGYRQVITPGRNGLLVDVRNPEAYAEALVAVLSRPALAERLRREGLRTARRYAWPEIARQVEQVYLEALREAHRLQ